MSSTTTRDGTSTGGMLTGYRWLAIANALGILVQAVLASQGVFAGHRDLITGHGQLGNLLNLPYQRITRPIWPLDPLPVTASAD